MHTGRQTITFMTRFLTGRPRSGDFEEGFAPYPPVYFIGFGLLTGLAWTAIFRISWRLFGEIGGIRPLPAILVLAADSLILASPLYFAWSRVAGRFASGNEPEKATRSVIFLVVLLLLQFCLLLSVLDSHGYWPSPDSWRSFFNWANPRPIYRPLLLAPIWGRWGILVAACIGRAANDSDIETKSVVERTTPIGLLIATLLPFLLTTLYGNRAGNVFTGPMIGIVLFVATYLYAVRLAHRFGGQTRDTLLSAGLFAQIVFFILYRAFWPLMQR